MNNKQVIPWALALLFAVLASSQLLLATGGKAGQVRAVAAPTLPVQATRWQYKLVNASGVNDRVNSLGVDKSMFLNASGYEALGQQGWELAGVVPYETSTRRFDWSTDAANFSDHAVVLVFKKPL